MGRPNSSSPTSGGAYTSHDFEAVCRRLQLQHETIESTKGESYQNLMETHFNIQRRLYDSQFSLARTPAELEQRHQAFIQTYNATAHQGLWHDRRQPPIPLEVLGEAKGRLYTPEDLTRHFSQAVFPRTTNQYGCVRLHRYRFSVAEGLPHTRVLLWVSGEQLRAVCDTVVFAAYRCRYDWRDRRVKDIRDGRWYTTRCASPQGTLMPLTPRDSRVVYHPMPVRRRTRNRSHPPQLALFERGHTG
jgi:hypothetical protein